MGRCEYCKRSTVKNKSGSFHRFPMDAAQSEIWVKNMGREGWVPRKDSVLCSDHFTPDCFDRMWNRIRLKKGSRPTIFVRTDGTYTVDTSACLNVKRPVPLRVEALKPKQETSTKSSHKSPVKKNSLTTVPMDTSDQNFGLVTKRSVPLRVESIKTKQDTPMKTSPKKNTLISVPTSSTVQNSSRLTTINLKTSTAGGKGGKSPQIQRYQLKAIMHDHHYTDSPQTNRSKLLATRRKLDLARKANKVLKQRVKRLKMTLNSLKVMFNIKKA